MGHSRSDPATYRPEGELEQWMARDPIPRFERALGDDHGVPAEDIERVRAEATTAVAEAVQRALDWPEPDPAGRFAHVWAVAG